MKTCKFLPALIAALFVMGLSQLHAQVDTVCAGTQGKAYWVQGTSGSTFSWIINGGSQASGGSTDSITVDWSATAGTDTLKVVEISADGCIGDTMLLTIVRMPLPTASISGSTFACESQDSTNITIDFTGSFPWTFTYTDGSGNYSFTTATTPYVFNTGLLSTGVTYTLTAVSDRLGCDGTTSGSAVITVNPKPSTSGIFFQ